MFFGLVVPPIGAQQFGHLLVNCPFCAAAPRCQELTQIFIEDCIVFEDDLDSLEAGTDSLFGMIMNSADIWQEDVGIRAAFIRDPLRAASLIEERLPLEL